MNIIAKCLAKCVRIYVCAYVRMCVFMQCDYEVSISTHMYIHAVCSSLHKSLKTIMQSLFLIIL